MSKIIIYILISYIIIISLVFANCTLPLPTTNDMTWVVTGNVQVDELKVWHSALTHDEIFIQYSLPLCYYDLPIYLTPPPNNVPCWDQLVNGNITQAAFCALDKPLSPHGEGGYLLLGFFVVLSIVIVVTSTVEISFILGMLFLAIFAVAQWINVFSRGIIIAILVFELGAILYKNFFKNN